MADGSIIFETSLDTGSLETSLNECLNKLKQFGNAGAKAIGKVSGLKVDGYKELNDLLATMTEKAKELEQSFKGIAASTPKDTTSRGKTSDTSSQTQKETDAINKKEEAVENLAAAQTKQVQTEKTLKNSGVDLKNVKEYSDKAKDVTQLEVAEMKLANAERKLADIGNTKGEDSIEFKEQALAVQKQREQIEKLILAREKLNAKQTTPQKTKTSAEDKAAAKAAEQAAKAAEKTAAANAAKKAQLAEAAFRGLNSAVGTTINLFKKLGGAALGALAKITVKPLISSFKTLGRVAATAISKGITAPFKAMAKPLQSLATRWEHFKKLLTKVTIYKGFRMMMQQIVKALKEGVEALYRWGQAQNSGIGSDFVKNLDKIVTALSYLKYTVSAIFAPIVNYFAPMIDAWTDKLVAKLNVIGASIASAFGESTFVKAVKIPQTYADQLDKASKKSKELKRSLMSFDKLNRLDGDNNKDEETDYSKYFEVASVAEEKLLTLKSVMDKFLNADMKGFGSKLGKRLQKITKSVNKFFKTTNFQKIGEQIAEFFNGLIAEFDGKELGKLLGNAFKAVLDLVTGFLRKLNAKKVGEAIANIFIGIVEVLEEIDIADTINVIFTAVIDALDGFINKLFEVDENGNDIFVRIANMISTGINSMVDTLRNNDKITDDISKIIFGIFELISTTLENIDWKAMAATGLKLINSFIKSIANIIKQIDTKKMADSINDVVHTLLADGSLLTNILNLMQALFEGATSLLVELFNTSGTEIAQTIADGINRIFAYLGTEDAQESLRVLFESLTNVMVTLIKEIDWAVVGTTIISCIGSAIEGVGDASPIALAIGKVIAGLFVGGKLLSIISGAMKGITGKGLLATIIGKLFSGGSEAGAAATLGSKITGLFAKIGPALSSVATALGTTVAGLTAAFAAVVVAVVAVIKNWDSLKEAGKLLVEEIGIFAHNLWIDIKEFGQKIKEWFDGIFKKIAEFAVKIRVKFDEIKTKFLTWFNNISKKAAEFAVNIWEKFTGLKEKFDGITTYISQLKDKIINKIKEFVNNGIDVIEGFINKIFSGINSLIKALNSIKIDLPDWAEKLTGGKVGSIGFNIPLIPEVHIPRLATGTVVPANFGQFAAILGDNKTEPEVVSPLSTMKQAFKEALTEMGGFQIDASDVYIDGQRVGKIVFDVHNNTVARTGKTPLKGV